MQISISKLIPMGKKSIDTAEFKGVCKSTTSSPQNWNYGILPWILIFWLGYYKNLQRRYQWFPFTTKALNMLPSYQIISVNQARQINVLAWLAIVVCQGKYIYIKIVIFGSKTKHWYPVGEINRKAWRKTFCISFEIMVNRIIQNIVNRNDQENI